MDVKAEQYLVSGLNVGLGLVIIDYRWAYRARPDLWITPFNCAQEWNMALPQMPAWFALRPGIRFFAVKLSDETLSVAAYSAHQLGERVNWQTGRQVLSIRQIEAGEVFQIAQASQRAPPLRPEEEAIPGWPCERRSEMLNAQGLPPDPPPRSSRSRGF